MFMQDVSTKHTALEEKVSSLERASEEIKEKINVLKRKSDDHNEEMKRVVEEMKRGEKALDQNGCTIWRKCSHRSKTGGIHGGREGETEKEKTPDVL